MRMSLLRRACRVVGLLLALAAPAAAQTEIADFPGKVRIDSTASDAFCVGSSGGASPTCTGGIKGGAAVLTQVTVNGVGIIATDGRIPAISSTYFASLSAANLTSIPAGQLTGTITSSVQDNITRTGALNSGSITSGFGSIDVGADSITGGAFSGTTGVFSSTIGVTGAADFSSTATLTRALAANTGGDGYILTNTTAATSGNQRYSPRVHWTGQGWKTDATAASQTVDMIAELRPVQGAANPSSILAFASQINGGGYTDRLTLTSAGALTVSGGITAGSGAVGIVDSTGKIPALTSTYFASLSFDASSLTGTIASGVQDNITRTGALNVGSITSGFGAIDVGTDAITGGVITASSGVLISGGTFAASKLYRDSSNGVVLVGFSGSNFDIRWLNGAGTPVINVVAGTADVTMPNGSLTVGSAKFIVANATGNITTAGTINIGGATAPGAGTFYTVFAQGTIPSSLAANSAAISAVDVSGTAHMFAISEGGVSMQLTGAANNTLATVVQDNIVRTGALNVGSITSGFGAIDIGSDSVTAGAVILSDKITTYNNITTAGNGVPSIYASGRSISQTAAVASVATYTVGAADASFEVMANVKVTTATTHNFTVAVDYTDESNAARTLTLSFTLVAGGALVTAVANGNGAVPYMGVPQLIRCKASTTITIKTTGTFTTVTYNVEGHIIKIA